MFSVLSGVTTVVLVSYNEIFTTIVTFCENYSPQRILSLIEKSEIILRIESHFTLKTLVECYIYKPQFS